MEWLRWFVSVGIRITSIIFIFPLNDILSYFVLFLKYIYIIRSSKQEAIKMRLSPYILFTGRKPKFNLGLHFISQLISVSQIIHSTQDWVSHRLPISKTLNTKVNIYYTQSKHFLLCFHLNYIYSLLWNSMNMFCQIYELFFAQINLIKLSLPVFQWTLQ